MTAKRTTARIPPVPPDEWDDDVVAALRRGLPRGPLGDRYFSDGPDALRAPNGLTTLVRHPALASRWLAYNTVLLGDPTISTRLRELVILRVAWRARAEYEWVQHVRLALRSDITAEEIDVIAERSATPGWSPLEAALLAATDQLLDRYDVDDDTWSVLASDLDQRQLVEFLFIVGTYTCLAMVFNGTGMQLDPDLADVPAPPLPDA